MCGPHIHALAVLQLERQWGQAGHEESGESSYRANCFVHLAYHPGLLGPVLFFFQQCE